MDQMVAVVVAPVAAWSYISCRALWLQHILIRVITGLVPLILQEETQELLRKMRGILLVIQDSKELFGTRNVLVGTVVHSVKLVQLVLISMIIHTVFVLLVKTSQRQLSIPIKVFQLLFVHTNVLSTVILTMLTLNVWMPLVFKLKDLVELFLSFYSLQFLVASCLSCGLA